MIRLKANFLPAAVANWGKGQVLGVVDAGIVARNPVLAAGQVSTARSSCAAISFKCFNGAFRARRRRPRRERRGLLFRELRQVCLSWRAAWSEPKSRVWNGLPD